MNRWSSPFEEDDAVRPAAQRSGGGGGSWVLLFACGALLVVAALFWISQGRFFDSAIYVAISDTSWKTIDESTPAAGRFASAALRFYGALAISAGVLVMGIAANSYRRGERWAWYIFWALPLCATLDLATLAAYSALSLRNAAWDLALLALSLIGLIVPYQSFFPVPRPRRSQPQRAAP